MKSGVPLLTRSGWLHNIDFDYPAETARFSRFFHCLYSRPAFTAAPISIHFHEILSENLLTRKISKVS